jgi:hypothetical protein
MSAEMSAQQRARARAKMRAELAAPAAELEHVYVGPEVRRRDISDDPLGERRTAPLLAERIDAEVEVWPVVPIAGVLRPGLLERLDGIDLLGCVMPTLPELHDGWDSSY